ncbi:MAG: rhodanese-like domain-containing protein [Planctomycetota bacterium]
MQQRLRVVPVAAAFLICAGIFLGGCSGGSSGGGGAVATTSNTELLWSVSRLEQEMAIDQGLVVLDCRNTLANPGPNNLTDYDNKTYKPGEIHTPYKIEHIKGAHYINFFLFGDPNYPTDDSQVIATLSALGITTSTPICLYDDAIANPQGKVFYHLERLGCTKVHILDGGYPAWVAANKPVETAKTPDPAPSTFVASIDNSIYLELDGFKAIWDKVDDDIKNGRVSEYAIIDYREDPLFYGHKICPDALRTGQIRYTTLLNWKTYMDAAGFLKSQEDIIKLTEAAGGSRNKINILICNKGWRSGYAYFALRYAGWPKSILKHYVGGVRAWTLEDETDYPMDTDACYRVGKNMPVAAGSVNPKRFAGAAAQVGSKLYCIGGYEVAEAKSTIGKTDKVRVSAVNQAFDMTQPVLSQQWENNLKPLPVATAFSAGAAVNGYIYVIGGVTGTLDAPAMSDTVYRWDSLNPTSDWQTMAPLPIARLSYAAVTVGNQIYVFGGLTDPDAGPPANYSNDFYRYNHDPSGIGSWENLNALAPNAPHARRCHALVAQGNTLYLVAGFYKEDNGTGGINNVDLRDVWAIDTTNLAAGWVQKADLPMDVAGHSAGIANGNIYVLGGWSLDGVKYDVLEYDITHNRSRQLSVNNGTSAAIGWPRYWYFLGVYGNEIASIGGYGGGSGYIKTTDTSGFVHFHQPYIYNVIGNFDPYQ